MHAKRSSRSFVLTADVLREHRAGQTMMLSPKAIGRSFSLADGPTEEQPETDVSSRVAMIGIGGPLTQRAESFLCGYTDGYDAITSRFEAAIGDPNVGSVVLVIDSPGGDAAGNLEAVRRMQSIRASSGKDVYAFADELAASAAYALSTVANKGLYLPESGEVGSIGTVMVHVDQSRALEQDGLNVSIFRSGEQKFEGNSLEPLSDSAKERIQSDVDALAKQFAGIVAESRGLSVDAVMGLQGATFMGQAAVEKGLANGVSTLEGVMMMAAKSAEERSNRMTVAKALGLPDSATREQIEAHAMALKARADVGEYVISLSNGADPRNVIASWVESHAELGKVRLQREAELKAAEETERDSLVVKLIESGWELPATAWADPSLATDKTKRQVAEPYASMSLEALRKRVATLSSEPRGIAAEKTPAGLLVPSKEDEALAKQLNVSPKSLADARLEMALAGVRNAGIGAGR